MTGREDLSELQALAEEISDAKHGRRTNRRDRALERAEKRLHDAARAPIKRRRRHRVLAGSFVGLVALSLVGVGIEIHRSSYHHTPPAKSVTNVRSEEHV